MSKIGSSFRILTCLAIAIAILNLPCSGQRLSVDYLGGPEGALFGFFKTSDKHLFLNADGTIFMTDTSLQWHRVDQGHFATFDVANDTIVSLTRDCQNSLLLKVSDNLGERWDSIYSMPLTYRGDLEIFNDTIYVSQGNRSKVYYSADLGSTWDTVAFDCRSCHDLWEYEDNLFIAGSDRLFVKGNISKSWTKIEVPISTYNDNLIDLIYSNDHLALAGQNNLFVSKAPFTSWVITPTQWSNNPFKLAVVDSTWLFDQDGIYISYDFGINWDTLNINEEDVMNSIGFNGNFYHVFADDACYEYDIQSKVLSLTSLGLHSAYIRALSRWEKDIYIASSKRIWRYNTDSDIWTHLETVPNPQFHYNSIACDSNTILVTEMGSSNIHVSYDFGESWKTTAASVNSMNIGAENAHVNADTLFLFADLRIHYSVDSAKEWNVANARLSQRNEVVHVAEQGYFTGSFSKLFSSNNLIEWQEKSSNLEIIGLLAFDNTLYGLGDSNSDFGLDLWVLNDQQRWEVLTDNLPYIDYSIYLQKSVSIDIFESDGRLYLIWGDHGLLESEDDGITWKTIDCNLVGNAFVKDDCHVYVGHNGLKLIETCATTNAVMHSTPSIEIAVSPNPCFESIFLDKKAMDQMSCQYVTLFDSRGSAVEKLKLSQGMNSHCVLDVSRLQPGLYFGKVECQNTVSVHFKFLKL